MRRLISASVVVVCGHPTVEASQCGKVNRENKGLATSEFGSEVAHSYCD
jgi:hypothetical protein